jgi:hypothetical protein
MSAATAMDIDEQGASLVCHILVVSCMWNSITNIHLDNHSYMTDLSSAYNRYRRPKTRPLGSLGPSHSRNGHRAN